MSTFWSSVKSHRSREHSGGPEEPKEKENLPPKCPRRRDESEGCLNVSRLVRRAQMRLPQPFSRGARTASLPKGLQDEEGAPTEHTQYAHSPKSKGMRKRAASASPSRLGREIRRSFTRDRIPGPLRNLFSSSSPPPATAAYQLPPKPTRRPGPVGKSWIKVYDDIKFMDDEEETLYPVLAYTGYPTIAQEPQPLPRPPTPPSPLEHHKSTQSIGSEYDNVPRETSMGEEPHTSDEFVNCILDQEQPQLTVEVPQENLKSHEKQWRGREISRYKGKRQKRIGTPIARGLPQEDFEDELDEPPFKPPRGNKVYDSVAPKFETPPKSDNPVIETPEGPPVKTENASVEVALEVKMHISEEQDEATIVKDEIIKTDEPSLVSEMTLTNEKPPLAQSEPLKPERGKKIYETLIITKKNEESVPVKPSRGLKLYENIGFNRESKEERTLLQKEIHVSQEEPRVAYDAPHVDQREVQIAQEHMQIAQDEELKITQEEEHVAQEQMQIAQDEELKIVHEEVHVAQEQMQIAQDEELKIAHEEVHIAQEQMQIAQDEELKIAHEEVHVVQKKMQISQEEVHDKVPVIQDEAHDLSKEVHDKMHIIQDEAQSPESDAHPPEHEWLVTHQETEKKDDLGTFEGPQIDAIETENQSPPRPQRKAKTYDAIIIKQERNEETETQEGLTAQICMEEEKNEDKIEKQETEVKEMAEEKIGAEEKVGREEHQKFELSLSDEGLSEVVILPPRPLRKSKAYDTVNNIKSEQKEEKEFPPYAKVKKEKKSGRLREEGEIPPPIPPKKRIRAPPRPPRHLKPTSAVSSEVVPSPPRSKRLSKGMQVDDLSPKTTPTLPKRRKDDFEELITATLTVSPGQPTTVITRNGSAERRGPPPPRPPCGPSSPVMPGNVIESLSLVTSDNSQVIVDRTSDSVSVPLELEYEIDENLKAIETSFATLDTVLKSLQSYSESSHPTQKCATGENVQEVLCGETIRESEFSAGHELESGSNLGCKEAACISETPCEKGTNSCCEIPQNSEGFACGAQGECGPCEALCTEGRCEEIRYCAIKCHKFVGIKEDKESPIKDTINKDKINHVSESKIQISESEEKKESITSGFGEKVIEAADQDRVLLSKNDKDVTLADVYGAKIENGISSPESAEEIVCKFEAIRCAVSANSTQEVSNGSAEQVNQILLSAFDTSIANQSLLEASESPAESISDKNSSGGDSLSSEITKKESFVTSSETKIGNVGDDNINGTLRNRVETNDAALENTIENAACFSNVVDSEIKDINRDCLEGSTGTADPIYENIVQEEIFEQVSFTKEKLPQQCDKKSREETVVDFSGEIISESEILSVNAPKNEESVTLTEGLKSKQEDEGYASVNTTGSIQDTVLSLYTSHSHSCEKEFKVETGNKEDSATKHESIARVSEVDVDSTVNKLETVSHELSGNEVEKADEKTSKIVEIRKKTENIVNESENLQTSECGDFHLEKVETEEVISVTSELEVGVADIASRLEGIRTALETVITNYSSVSKTP